MKEESRRKIMEIKRIISNNLTNKEKEILISKLFKKKVISYNGVKKIHWNLLNDTSDMYAVAINDVLMKILTDPHRKDENFKHLEYLINNFTSVPKRYHITVDEMYNVNNHQPIMRCVIDIEQPHQLIPSDEVNYILKILKEFGY